jgi:hypothetical protein
MKDEFRHRESSTCSWRPIHRAIKSRMNHTSTPFSSTNGLSFSGACCPGCAWLWQMRGRQDAVHEPVTHVARQERQIDPCRIDGSSANDVHIDTGLLCERQIAASVGNVRDRFGWRWW